MCDIWSTTPHPVLMVSVLYSAVHIRIYVQTNSVYRRQARSIRLLVGPNSEMDKCEVVLI